MEIQRKWWKEAVIYQVYPRSFQDSNGDGIGDIRGVISRLDYIASLGVNAVWLNPVYLSSGHDNGYDIKDFKAIEPEYGTMEDVQELIDGLHARGMRVIMDMVLNHTSEEHEWFRRARSSREDPYYSYYHWWPAEKGEPPLRCGFFDAAGKGWTFNEATNSYYLHYFAPQQPDLNWENPLVRRELYEMLRYWLDKGVDGLRLDAICFISKDRSWPDITPEILKEKYRGDWGHFYASAPCLHEYLREMHEEVFSKYDVVTIGEAAGIGSDEALQFAGELDMLYHFDAIGVGYMPGEFKKVDPAGWRLREWKEVYTRWYEVLAGKSRSGQGNREQGDREQGDRDIGQGNREQGNSGQGWAAVYLGNHDQPRMVSRWGDDSEEWRAASAKLLLTFLLTMPGTPFIYNGDELGMTNIRFDRIEDYQDIETKRMYQNLKDRGGDTEGFLKDQQVAARDNGRTPFQWDGGPGAGFTSGTPWITVNPNFGRVNRAVQEGDVSSVLNYFRDLVQLRRLHPVLAYGDYELLLPEHPAVYGFSRSFEGERWVVILNFSKEEQRVVVEGEERVLGPYGVEIVR